MSEAISFIAGLGIGWWLAPALSDISRKIKEEIEEWRYR